VSPLPHYGSKILFKKGILKGILFIAVFLFFALPQAQAAIRVVVISDSLLTETNPYNIYSNTPRFLVQDISDILRDNRAFEVISTMQVQDKLKKNSMNSNDIKSLRNLHAGYELDFHFLKDVSNIVGTDYIVVVTSTIERERDFLKNTLWNTLNIAGLDTVNPTQRISVYAVLVDTKNERVLWEEIYAKNIRNNKFKNLDASLGGDPEGMMRLKQYSKYISPEIAANVALSLAPNTVQPEVYINKFENVAFKINKKMRVGSNKKLKNDNTVLNAVFKAQQDATDKTKEVAKDLGQKTKNGTIKLRDKMFNDDEIEDINFDQSQQVEVTPL